MTLIWNSKNSFSFNQLKEVENDRRKKIRKSRGNNEKSENARHGSTFVIAELSTEARQESQHTTNHENTRKKRYITSSTRNKAKQLSSYCFRRLAHTSTHSSHPTDQKSFNISRRQQKYFAKVFFEMFSRWERCWSQHETEICKICESCHHKLWVQSTVRLLQPHLCLSRVSLLVLELKWIYDERRHSINHSWMKAVS